MNYWPVWGPGRRSSRCCYPSSRAQRSSWDQHKGSTCLGLWRVVLTRNGLVCVSRFFLQSYGVFSFIFHFRFFSECFFGNLLPESKHDVNKTTYFCRPVTFSIYWFDCFVLICLLTFKVILLMGMDFRDYWLCESRCLRLHTPPAVVILKWGRTLTL